MTEIDVSNDPEIERLGANATAIFALEYFQTLQIAARKDSQLLDPTWGNENANDTAHYTTQLCLTKDMQQDIRLYRRFRSNFGTLDVSAMTADMLSGTRWASLLLASEGVIADFNFITLLREHVNSIFWMNEHEVCDGLLVVPRAQFIFIEVTRIHEAMYGSTFRRNVHLWDTKTQADALEAALVSGQKEQDGLMAVHLLKTQWPYPKKNVLKQTNVISVLKRGMAATTTSEPLQQACRDLLQYWQDILDLGIIQKGLVVPRHGQVVERATRALSRDSTKGDVSSTQRVPIPVKTTSSFNDVVLIHHNDTKSSQRIFGTYGMLVVHDFVQGDVLKQCQDQSKMALHALIKEHLEPRGLKVDGLNEFDFAQVRQRPGHRVDNRFNILDDPNSPIAMLSQQLCDSLPGFLAKDKNGKVVYKVLHGGVVHSFPRESENDPIPEAQLWHRDGPSLFTTAHHDTHCFNVFIPLIDVTTENGTTEFIPGTHDDDCFEELVGEVIQLSQEDPSAQHPLAIRAHVTAGTAVIFDVRVLHRGLSNASMTERPMLYFTIARDWFVEEHMFSNASIVEKANGDDTNAVLMDRLYQLVTGKEHRPIERDYGHPHYTDRFDLILMDVVEDKKRTKNMAAILAFCASNDKNDIAESFLDLLRCPSSHRQKQAILEASREKRKINRIREADVYLDYKPFQEEEDFASISADMSDVGALYALTAKLILEDSILLSKLGFSADQDGILLVMALLKAYAATATSIVTPDALEEAFTSWWHAGAGRFSLTDNGCENVLVVFSSLGSGIARPEWSGSLKNMGSIVDVLHVLDPAFSWYCQDPHCQWNGGEYYENELARRLKDYKGIMFLGDSMGAAAALRFSKLAHNVLAFTPQVDITRYDAITRSDFSSSRRESFKTSLIEAVGTTLATITIHYGNRCDEDVQQVRLLPTRSNLTLVDHDYDDHILSLHLRDLGKLQGIIEDAVNSFVE